MNSNDAFSVPSVPFTRTEAMTQGLSAGHLRNKRIINVGRGLYRPQDWNFELSSAARALCAVTPEAWISHTTAARLHEMVLPPWCSGSDQLHLSKPRKLPGARRKGIIGHTVVAFPGEVETDGDLRISGRARTWLDLAHILNLDDLVCTGDQLIRIPRQEFEDRQTPYSTLVALRELVGRHRNLQGIVRARAALELMRVGADSAPETLLRLAMLDAGLPEPDLQVTLWPRPGAPSADAGYRSRRIALQYDGVHHLDEQQRQSDRRRDKAFEAAGWTVLVFTQADLADSFQDAVRVIKNVLRHARVDPRVSSGFATGS